MATGKQGRVRSQPTVYPPASAWQREADTRTAYIYMLPALLVMGIITFYPLLYGIWMSFTDYGLKNLRAGSPAPNFVGFDNYLRILTNNLGVPNFNFFGILVFNIWWALSSVILNLIVGVLVAVILNTDGLWGRRIYRVIYVLPVVIPILIVATVWRNMFDADYGPINQLLAKIGGLFGYPAELFHIRWIEQVEDPIPFIPLPLSYFALLIANLWMGWPLTTIVATSSLQSISEDLYEAAAIDGASRRQMFLNITLPMLRPAMLPYAIYGFMMTFNLFYLIFFLSGGKPFRRTEILVSQVFYLVNGKRLYGVAAALTVLIFFTLLVLSLIANYLEKELVDDNYSDKERGAQSLSDGTFR